MDFIDLRINFVVASLAFLYFILQLCFLKFWQKKVRIQIGELILKTISPKNSKAIITLILCPALIVFSLITKSTTFVCILMSLIASLACYIVCKEIVYSKLNGVYQNGLIGSGKFIPFDRIKSFPNTSWKEPEKEETIDLAIELIAANKKKKEEIIFITYATISEYAKVVQTIKDLKQNK